MSTIPFITMTPNVGVIPSSDSCEETCRETMNGLPLINRSNMCVCFIPPKNEEEWQAFQSTILDSFQR
jgi:hypothetical protein